MYNNIGLLTPRGSGTSGHVQNNKFNLTRPPPSRAEVQKAVMPPPQRQANKGILDHNRKREIENKVLLRQEELLNEGLGEDEVQVLVDQYRAELLAKESEEGNDANGAKDKGPGIEERIEAYAKDMEKKGFTKQEIEQQCQTYRLELEAAAAQPKEQTANETHEVAKRREEKLSKLREAWGLPEDVKEGDAFNKEVQEARKAERLAEKERRQAEREEREREKQKQAKKIEKERKRAGEEKEEREKERARWHEEERRRRGDRYDTYAEGRPARRDYTSVHPPRGLPPGGAGYYERDQRAPDRYNPNDRGPSYYERRGFEDHHRQRRQQDTRYYEGSDRRRPMEASRPRRKPESDEDDSSSSDEDTSSGSSGSTSGSGSSSSSDGSSDSSDSSGSETTSSSEEPPSKRRREVHADRGEQMGRPDEAGGDARRKREGGGGDRNEDGVASKRPRYEGLEDRRGRRSQEGRPVTRPAASEDRWRMDRPTGRGAERQNGSLGDHQDRWHQEAPSGPSTHETDGEKSRRVPGEAQRGDREPRSRHAARGHRHSTSPTRSGERGSDTSSSTSSERSGERS